MTYHLRIWALGHGSGIEIAESDYTAIMAAMERIYLATGIEEKLDLLVENFLEYERELLELTLQNSLFRSHDDNRVFREIQRINRRVINLLSAARMYIDHVKHSVSQYFASGQAPDVKSLFSIEYDQYLEYRIADELRNHVQHRELPVHQISWSSRWEEMESPQKRLRFWGAPSIFVEELANAGKFKASVLAELRSSGRKEFSLTPILRRYVESLASVHAKVRESLASQAEADRQTLVATLERARTELQEGLTGLVVSAGNDAEQPNEHHYISDRSWNRREALIKKNSRLAHLSRRYVSAEHLGDAGQLIPRSTSP